ncbi:DUF4011 domain-containing protein [Gordonia otitidis]|nr:DUF4011 domain-containing protein [Gordonia otitidis]
MSTTPVETTHTVEQDGLRVSIHALPAVNLALVHNGVPLISAIEITNAADVELTDLTVTAHLLSGEAELTAPITRTHDGRIAPGASVVWDDFAQFVPATEFLKTLNESQRGSLTLSVSSVWATPTQITIPIRVLAHNEWFAQPVFYDSLAAFVQPNTHSVTAVLDDAAEILRVDTGDSSLGGYQRGPQRAALIAAAIYEALHVRGIRYIDPPASFENTGQKVRTTSQVLEERFGTCIDLSVAYAACLEAAGLRPLLWIMDTHAFAGFLRDDSTSLPQPSILEENAMINLVESGIGIPVDAIFYADGKEGSFASAVSSGRRFFGDPSRLRGVLSVAAARRDGVRPLPSADEVAPPQPAHEASSPRPALSLPPELLTSVVDDPILATEDDAPRRVQNWKRSLLDLSTRNRLLNLRASAEVIDLHVPSGGLAILDDLAHAGKRITFTPSDELSAIHQLQGARRAADIEPSLLLEYLQDDRNVYVALGKDAYTRRFKQLSRTARTMFEETGSANLYLTLGAIIHKVSSGTEARAPLFLLPVKIVGGTGRSPFGIEIDSAGIATPNHCLVQWLKLKHNVIIDALENPKTDASGIDISHALRSIREALVSEKLDLRIDEVATVSICQFGTFGMWKDLEDSWEILEQSPIVAHLTHNAGSSFHDPQADDDTLLEQIPVDETQVPVPIPADGSQLRAIALAAEGRSFVLEGPPGTGKSQTITNLIAHALSKGKTVLFVAEKQAALDVVKSRLAKIGLSDFALDLHGKSLRPNEIREQLRRAMDNSTAYNEYGWSARLAEFRSKAAPLEDYPSKVHSRNGIDESLWRAYEAVVAVGDGPSAPVSKAYVTQPQEPQSTIVDALEQFSRAARSVTLAKGSPWAIAGPEPTSSADEISSATAQLSQSLRLVSEHSLTDLLRQLEGPERIARILPQARRQLGRPIPKREIVQWWQGPQFTSTKASLFAGLTALQSSSASVVAALTPLFVESGDVESLIAQAVEASKGVFGKKKRHEQFQRDLAPFTLDGNGLAPESALPLLRAIPTIRDASTRLRSDVAQTLGPYAPASWNPLSPDAQAALSDSFTYVEATAAFAQSEAASWNLLVSVGFPDEPSIGVLEHVVSAWEAWHRRLRPSTDDAKRWLNGRGWIESWTESQEAWDTDAAESGSRHILGWSRASAFLEPLRSAGMDDVVSSLLDGELPASDAPVAFMRGAAKMSVRVRLDTEGLAIFDAALRDGEIDDFARASAALRDEQTKALPAQLLARRPFKEGGLRGEVGELRRALDRKRGGASFRSLVSRYGEHIQAATPVMFVSPASLAQFIPPGSITFDLVVFDEASQVTVPQAIGALGRGRTAVIAGDSQQMPPTSIGQVTANDDDTDDDDVVVPADMESILSECVDSGVPRLWLSWHYRSQDESLINFSNQKYYEGRLASLPSPGGDDTAGVEWRRVNGQFNREDRKTEFRTNRVEAEEIVAEIRARLASPRLGAQSIGVVTFNKQQQTLVQDLLEASDDPLVRAHLRPELDEPIFVKNLENVQGDERDVILFSAAFSKRPGESNLPLNFGPLSQTGGEKRFNVAITRARRKVIIFTSFDPSDIDLARTRSVGLAHLRGYLEMAGHGVQPNQSRNDSRGDAPSAVQEAVCAALRERGYEVELNYGLSEFVLDLVVRETHSPKWQVAVMLDGPRWASRPTVADRDLTPRLLEPMMHWGAVTRIWLPEWIESPDAALKRVDEAVARANERQKALEAKIEEEAAAQAAAIEQAKSTDNEDTEDSEAESVDTTEHSELHWEKRRGELHTNSPSVVDSDSRDSPPRVATILAPQRAGAAEALIDTDSSSQAQRDWDSCPAEYVSGPSTVLGSRDDLDRVNSKSVRSTITEAARRTVAAEGPIELDRLAKDIGRRFGYDRVSAARKEFITSCVPDSLVRKGPLGKFVWPHDVDIDGWRGFRSTPADLTRLLPDIAPEEIANAMAFACRGRELDDETLMRETLALFGQKRLTEQNRERLRACIVYGIESGRLLRVRGAIRAGA